jgi:outer membrane autotransporter protein
VGQSMPFLHGNAALVGLTHSGATGAAIEQQLKESGTAGGQGQVGRQLWVKPVGNWSEQDAANNVSGYKLNTQGIVGGVQSDVQGGTTLGVGLGYLDSDIKGKDFAASHSGDMESLQLLGYGRHALGDGGWQLKWQGDYTRSRIDSRRVLSFAGRTAQAKYDGDAWHVGLGVSKAYAMGGLTVSPLVALDWRRFKSDGYTESGAGALDFEVRTQKAQEAIVKVGAQLEGDISSRTQWLARAAVGYDLKDQDNGVTARFVGGGLPLVTPGLERSRSMAELGLGVRFRAGEGMELTARYDLQLRSGLRDQSASVRLAWAF